jgi:hypothetical protein
MIGKWKWEETYSASPFGPAGKGRWKCEGKMLHGGSSMKRSDRGSARTSNRDGGTSCHGAMRTLPPIGFRSWRCREGSITAPTGLRAATR